MKSNRTPKRGKSAPKFVQCFCSLQDGDAHIRAQMEAMRPQQALAAMRGVVDEMRTIMGRGKVGQKKQEPQWLTDAVDAELSRLRKAVRNSRSVDEE